MIQFRPALPLNGNMLNSEPVMKLSAGLFDKRVVISGIRFQKVHGKRRFRGTHGPYVQIVNTGDAGQVGQIGFDGFRINAGGHRIQGQVKRIAQQPPGSDKNNGCDSQTDNRINPRPAGGQDDNAGQNHARRYPGVGCHMQKSTPYVQIRLAPGQE